MKKKILAMLLLLSCVCVLVAGCVSDKKGDSSDKKMEIVDEKGKEEKKIQAERGAVVYRNEAFGVSFPISDKMTVCTDERIAETLNLGQGLLAEDGTYTAKKMEEAMQGAIYDIIILFSDKISSVSVIYEDMDQTQEMAIDEEQYAKLVRDSLSSLEVLNYEVGEIEKRDIGGTEFVSMTVNTDQLIQRYLLHRVDNYMIMFLFTYTSATEQEINDCILSITYEGK